MKRIRSIFYKRQSEGRDVDLSG